MPSLVIVRHGQSMYNLENRFTGDVDVPLTPAGKEEARAAGLKLRSFSFSCCFTSALQRAMETLSLILQSSSHEDLPVIKNKALNERSYGDLQGLNKTAVARQYGDEQVAIWRRSYTVRPPGGESLEDTFNRVIPYYQQTVLPLLQNGENILVVAHGNSLRALMKYLENLSDEEIAGVDLPTGLPRCYDMDQSLKILQVRYL